MFPPPALVVLEHEMQLLSSQYEEMLTACHIVRPQLVRVLCVARCVSVALALARMLIPQHVHVRM